MAIQVQLRRGDATANNAFTGAIGELSYDTTNNQVRVHDGSTAGGFKIGVGNFPTGTNNVALGNTALDSLDAGSPGGSNTAVGHDALTANTTASNNVAVGKDALKANTTAASSTAVGTSALAANTGTLNTAIGKDAGSLITSGTKNTIVGSFDGNQGGLDIRTSDSYIVLSDGDGNPRVIVNDSGNVGIGTSPSRDLHVQNTSGNPVAAITSSTTGSAYLGLGDTASSLVSYIRQDNSSGAMTVNAETTMIFNSNGSERARIDSSGNLLVGRTTTPSVAGAKIAILGSGDTAVQVTKSGVIAGRMSAVTTGLAFGVDTADGSTERMRLTSDGHFLVATTNDTLYSSSSDQGMAYRASGGQLTVSRASGQPLILNRLTDDGILIDIRRDGSQKGIIGINAGNNTVIGSTDSSHSGIQFGTNTVSPFDTNTYTSSDNTIDLGTSSARYDDVFATNGTIQTSDEREKQQIASLTDAEITAAKAISRLFKTFKWNDSVTEKGDNARTHAGVIAQQVETAMSDAGLDAGNYAFFISDTWWQTQTEVAAVEAVEAQDAVYEDVVIPAVEEVLDEDGNVVTEAQPERTEQRLVSEAVEAVEAQEAYTRTDTYHTQEESPEGATERNRKGIRYPELLSFIGAATEQRLTSIESRLDALEG